VPELSAQSLVKRVISATGVTPSLLPLLRQKSKASITIAFITENFPGKPAIIAGFSTSSQSLSDFFVLLPLTLPATEHITFPS
jgi:hypothetical protein